MPAAQPSKELRTLCYEHHVEMRRQQSLLDGSDDAGAAYGCTQPECFVHYSINRGYFILSHNGNGNEPDMLPRVRCPHDGEPMYLVEIDREKRDFRVWRCPQCDARRTNEEGLVGLALNKAGDATGRSVAQS